ncbi:LOW QUALITY PROTEIN: ciliated left-right organizer metallopeptidase [Megaptera novaeangliae]
MFARRCCCRCFPWGAATSRCLHDKTQCLSFLRPPFSQLPPHFHSSSLTLPSSQDPQPLRIQTCHIGDPVSEGAWGPEGGGVRGGSQALAAGTKAAQRLQGVLAGEQGPLLLRRDPAQYCHAAWGDPDTPNYHRCSLLKPGYQGQSCLGAKIPDAHLRGYALWPEQEPSQLIQPGGSGVQNTDFLLYVWVAHASKCHQEPSIVAYAACCQLDSEDRPLAGTIVFCAHLTSPSLSYSDMVMATLHELLHALGFSGRPFKKWRDCPSGPSGNENCSTSQQVTRRDEWGQLLHHSLAKHLGLLGVSLGAPLEEEVRMRTPWGDGRKRERSGGTSYLLPRGPLSSHWEALLQNCIMTATYDGAQRIRLDPITLAAFKDSGWYQVNHSTAEELWGWGSGLEFGLVTTCGNGTSDFFCTGSGLGCHYLHLDKGSCSSDLTLEGCRYKLLANGSECWRKENGFPPGAENPHGEIYHPHSCCFLANLTSQLLPGDKIRHPSQPTPQGSKPPGHCYLPQCTERGVYKVQVEGSPWVPCLPGKIPGNNGHLFCPRVFQPDLLFQLSLGLAGPPGHSLGKEEGEELTEAVLQGSEIQTCIWCYFHSLLITTSLVFTVHMWKSPGCQGPSVGMLHRALTLTLRKKPLEVYYGGATFTIEYSKFLVTSDHNPSMTHLGLSMGLCLMSLILVGALGTMAYQKRATLQVGPSAPYHSLEPQGATGGPVGGMREV